MKGEVLIKGLIALIFSGVMTWVVMDREPDLDGDSGRQRYLPYISGTLLPTFVGTILVMALFFLDAENAVRLTLSLCFGVFLHICLYYLLLPALPFLRRHISARTCAVLWMLPNYLYLTQMSYMRLPEPRWVIRAPLPLVQVLLVLWLAGFLAVLGWKILSHLAFRARILRPALPVTDPAVLAVWDREVEAARFRKPKFRLVVSPAVRTPLSVGLFRRAVRVVLPEHAYTPEQKWLMEHCWEYGFILRYLEDKCDITGIGYEPWHYRYVGREAALAMRDSGQCLEEYLEARETQEKSAPAHDG